MPYKNIGFRRPAVNPGEEPGQISNGVRVQWLKGEAGHVQLVTAPMIGGMPEGSFLESLDAKWVELNRHQVNDLIRTLRQARDDAFGKDE